MITVNDSDWQSRTRLLIGEEGIHKLNNAHVLVAGLGGVGAFATEILARAGIGTLTLIDSDKFNKSNINRQTAAFNSTVGKYKTDVLAERINDINPECIVYKENYYLKDEKIPLILSKYKYSYVLDAIDSVSPKVFLIYHAIKAELKVISSMGAGGKFDPMKLKIADISESYECPLAYDIRKKLHKLGIYTGVKVVFSDEKVAKEKFFPVDSIPNKKSIVGTISYMPALFGAYAASQIIRDILEIKKS